ncbi:B-cell receptor CD22-like [Astyanax mexicanus]|uniref:B-cell receptor CD22-like n=1 Tax=Astyanax mexicanus TaxID=7994 RepID=UPI0020CB39EA|nr:B-cell receptor CD22-like [Astyanax mexicanus]
MVNLTCSSDANPPVEIYTWFKEGGDSPVGSGQSYVPLQSGSYYCQAQNQHGAQRSAAVSVVSDILKNYYQSLILYIAVGAGGVCGLAITFITVFFCMRSRRKRQAGNVDEQIYANVMRETRPPHNDDNNDDNDDDDDDDILDYENVPVSSTC